MSIIKTPERSQWRSSVLEFLLLTLNIVNFSSISIVGIGQMLAR